MDGRVYRDQVFITQLEEYHSAAAGAHRGHTSIKLALPAGGHRALPVAEETAAATPYDQTGYEPPRPYEPGSHDPR